jgi:transposase
MDCKNMKKRVFIGIDFSKQTLDASFFYGEEPEVIFHEQVENSEAGCIKLIKRIKHRFSDIDRWLFCGEYTGIYSMTLAYALNKEGFDLWLESPLQIKLSSGICREKNDKVDSLQIALYAFRFIDRIKLYQLSSSVLLKIKELITFKDRLTKIKSQLLLPAKELSLVWKDWDEANYIYSASKDICDRINFQIKDIEIQMKRLLKEDPELNELYKVITSIKGVGIQTAIYLIVYTMGFTSFKNSRQLACYCGIAPFSKKSGTSLNAKAQVSHIANKKLKTLLHMCALNAIRYDTNISCYYNTKLREGKHKMKIINNVRNKLIHRIWAITQSKELYNMNYQLKNVA